MKAIEDQIKEKREHLDIETPPKELWDDIRDDWKMDERRSSGFHYWKVAAAILFATTIALIGYSISLKEEVQELASLGDISPEYQKIEIAYQSEIAQLTGTLSISDLSNDGEYGWVAEELQLLEDINQQYREDIGEDVDQELLVRALLDYYEKKIRLLKKLELEIKRQKNEKENTTDYSAI